MTLGPREREAAEQRIEEIKRQLQNLLEEKLPRLQLAEQWRRLLAELADLRDSLDGG